MNEHIDPVTGKKYRYKNGKGKEFEITMGEQDADGKWSYTTADGWSGYWDPSEEGSLTEVEASPLPSPQGEGDKANGENGLNGGNKPNEQTSAVSDERLAVSGDKQDEQPLSSSPEGEEAKPLSGDRSNETNETNETVTYGGDGYDGIITELPDYNDLAPTTTQLSNADWLAGLAPSREKREKSLRAKKAIDALNMVSQAVQVLGRMPNTNLGAGGAQPMLPDGYQKFMDRAYQQGMNYENTIAAREKVLNAGKKMQQDYQIKKQKMRLEQEKLRLYGEKNQLLAMAQQARANKDEQAAKYYEKQAEYKDAQIKALEAGVDIKRAVANAQIENLRNMGKNRDELTEIKKNKETPTTPAKTSDDDYDPSQYKRQTN